MHNETLATKTVEIGNLVIKYIFEAQYDGCLGTGNFNDQWERVSSHQGGVTINVGGEHYIPLQYSLAQLSKDYTKQGRENPCKAAYDSLRNQLERDSEAFEANVIVTVSKNDIELYREVMSGCDYHHDDFNYDHDKALESMLSDYCEQDSYIEEAKKVLNELTN